MRHIKGVINSSCCNVHVCTIWTYVYHNSGAGTIYIYNVGGVRIARTQLF